MTGQRPDPVMLLKVARWRTAEDQLFGGLVHDPERYQRCVGLMAVIAQDLQTTCSTKELALAADPGMVAAQAASTHGVDVAGLDLDLVGGAAMANHWWRLDLQDGPADAQEPSDIAQNGQG